MPKRSSSAGVEELRYRTTSGASVAPLLVLSKTTKSELVVPVICSASASNSPVTSMPVLVVARRAAPE